MRGVQWIICRLSVCTELDRLCFLASYNETYIMTANADDVVTDLPALKQIPFLWKNPSDDGKTLPVVLCITEWDSMFSMDFIPLYEKSFKESDHTLLEHPCPWNFPLSFLAVEQIGLRRIPIFVARTPYTQFPAMNADMPVESFQTFPEQFHIRRKTHMALIAYGITKRVANYPNCNSML